MLAKYSVWYTVLHRNTDHWQPVKICINFHTIIYYMIFKKVMILTTHNTIRLNVLNKKQGMLFRLSSLQSSYFMPQ